MKSQYLHEYSINKDKQSFPGERQSTSYVSYDWQRHLVFLCNLTKEISWLIKMIVIFWLDKLTLRTWTFVVFFIWRLEQRYEYYQLRLQLWWLDRSNNKSTNERTNKNNTLRRVVSSCFTSSIWDRVEKENKRRMKGEV